MRKIALISTSRADYGIQARLIRRLADDPQVDFAMIVSGTHLSARHGRTIEEIRKDGIPIAAEVEIGVDAGSPVEEMAARALRGFSSVLKTIGPDLVVLLGDRYEMLSAALACVFNGIPIAHLHGGETTAGATDEVFRHAITKAAYLHFTSCEEYRQRVIQLGEDPARVFNVGAMGVENARLLPAISREELASSLGMELRERIFVVTFHPVTFEQGTAVAQVRELLTALEKFADQTSIVFTHPNADREGDSVAEAIAAFAADHAGSKLVASLGSVRYLALVRIASAVIGNSSSGIIEVPSFCVPTVNIGDRQAGRVQASSVVNCSPDRGEIARAIDYALSSEHAQTVRTTSNPYDRPGTMESIHRQLVTCDLDGCLKKRFYDLGVMR